MRKTQSKIKPIKIKKPGTKIVLGAKIMLKILGNKK